MFETFRLVLHKQAMAGTCLDDAILDINGIQRINYIVMNCSSATCTDQMISPLKCPSSSWLEQEIACALIQG